MALQEHAENIKAAIKAAQADGLRVVLEDPAGDYGNAYVDLEEWGERDGRTVLVDWAPIIEVFD